MKAAPTCPLRCFLQMFQHAKLLINPLKANFTRPRPDITFFCKSFLFSSLLCCRSFPTSLSPTASGYSAVSKGFQLCNGGLYFSPPAHRGATVKPKASSHRSILHICGEFGANEFKRRWGLPRETLRSLRANTMPSAQLLPALVPFKATHGPAVMTG